MEKQGRSRGDEPCGRHGPCLNFVYALVPLFCLGDVGGRFCPSGLPDLQRQLHEKGQHRRASDGFRQTQLGGSGFWLERDLYVGRASFSGRRTGLAGGEKRERSFPESRFLKRAGGATA